MKREDDARSGQHASRQRNQVDAQCKKMVKVDHVRLQREQEFDIRIEQLWFRRLVPPVVVVAAEEQELALVSVESCDVRPRPVQRLLCRIYRRKERDVRARRLLE